MAKISEFTVSEPCLFSSGMCPAPDPEDGLQLTSTIEDLKAPIPELFDVLTEEKDIDNRWTTYTYPAHYDALYFKPGHGMLDVNFGELNLQDYPALHAFNSSKQGWTTAGSSCFGVQVNMKKTAVL